MSTASCYLFPY